MYQTPQLLLKLGISMLFVSILGTVSAAPITIINPGFEDTVVSPKVTGFDSTPDIAGWIDTAGAPGDSGVESSAANANASTQYAFLRGDNGGAFQVTSYQLQLGDQLSLTYFTKNVFSNGNSSVSLLSSATSTPAFADTLAIANRTDTLTQTNNPGPYQTFTLNYTATSADVGRFVGLSFDNTGDGGGYTFFDDFSLSVTPIPEPSTVISLLGGLALLGVTQRKRFLKA